MNPRLRNIDRNNGIFKGRKATNTFIICAECEVKRDMWVFLETHSSYAAEPH